MTWFTPERRLFVYRLTTSLLTVAVALNLLTQGNADEAVVVVSQILDAVTAASALLATVVAARNVPKV